MLWASSPELKVAPASRNEHRGRIFAVVVPMSAMVLTRVFTTVITEPESMPPSAGHVSSVSARTLSLSIRVGSFVGIHLLSWILEPSVCSVPCPALFYSFKTCLSKVVGCRFASEDSVHQRVSEFSRLEFGSFVGDLLSDSRNLFCAVLFASFRALSAGSFHSVRDSILYVYQRLGERLAKLFSGVIVRDMRETSKGQERS